MKNNLFISYDLNSPGQDYTTVIEKIKSLGSWAKIQKSHWYVSSNLSAKDALELVWSVMDSNDTLIVIDATNNDAYWCNFTDEVENFIQSNWNR